MAKMYIQGEPYLAVFSDQTEMYEFREETKGLRLQIQDLKEELQRQEEKVTRADTKYQIETEELLKELVSHPKFWKEFLLIATYMLQTSRTKCWECTKRFSEASSSALIMARDHLG